MAVDVAQVVVARMWRSADAQCVLSSYIMRPKVGYDYMTAGDNEVRFATRTTTKSVEALAYYIDPANDEMKIAYPTLLLIADAQSVLIAYIIQHKVAYVYLTLAAFFDAESSTSINATPAPRTTS